MFNPEFSIGINGGITLSKVNFMRPAREFVASQNLLRQYAAGVGAKYISERNVGVQVEINYSQRGWDEQGDAIINTSEGMIREEISYTRSLNYLEIPIYTHIYFNAGKRGRICFNIGPQLSFLLNEKVKKSHLFFEEGKEKYPYYTLDAQRKFDWGISGGPGFEWRTGIGSFALEGRYYFGLSDIFNPDKSKNAYFSTSSNQIITVKLVYFYRLK